MATSEIKAAAPTQTFAPPPTSHIQTRAQKHREKKTDTTVQSEWANMLSTHSATTKKRTASQLINNTGAIRTKPKEKAETQAEIHAEELHPFLATQTKKGNANHTSKISTSNALANALLKTSSPGTNGDEHSPLDAKTSPADPLIIPYGHNMELHLATRQLRMRKGALKEALCSQPSRCEKQVMGYVALLIACWALRQAYLFIKA